MKLQPIFLYTKEDCSLCADVKQQLNALQARFPHELVEIDIVSDSKTFAAYRTKIPVLQIGEFLLEAPIESEKLVVALQETLPA